MKRTQFNRSAALESIEGFQRDALRNAICLGCYDGTRIVSSNENFRLQGEMLARCGFSRMDARHPNDTWVGALRLEGWQRYIDNLT